MDPKKSDTEKRQEMIDRAVKIGVRIMPKFSAKPNPNKK
jgi:hypothetical protein